METILSIIIKYWVQEACVIVLSILSFLVKKGFDKYNKEKSATREKFLKDIKQEIAINNEREQEINDALQYQIDTLQDDMGNLRAGLLSIQGKEFKANCRKLLAENHTITLDEWEEIAEDHTAYNGLGGNHKGDHLFALVKQKAENTLTIVK